MLNGEEIISLYENVSAITGQMLQAAQQQDWARLETLESKCSREIEVIKTRGPLAPVYGDMRQRKIKLLQKILRDDRAIRDATEPWLNEIQALILNTGTRRKLAQHYLADDST